jgi:hypothetical protein
MAPQSQPCRVLSRPSNHLLDAQAEDSGIMQHTTMLKRRMSSEEVTQSLKKICRDDPMQTCPLTAILREYGLLEAILAELRPNDLLSLLLSSKSIHQTLAPRPGSLTNLLGKLRCSGRGVEIRKGRHKKSTFFYAYECTEYVPCSATVKARSVEMRPCVSCKVTTCDECRIHCVYQSHFEKPCDEDELPNFSGFVLLSAPEIPILSPHHLVPDEPTSKWQDPSQGLAGPYHDQGFMDVPYEDEAFGPPEDVSALLDIDLGRHALAGSVLSNVLDPSPVLRTLHEVTEQRKRCFCDACLSPQLAERPQGCELKVCQCTLRSHLLDRWLCLQCYETEENSFAKAYSHNRQRCGCGQQTINTICMWCRGLVLNDPQQQHYHEDTNLTNGPTTPLGSP